VEQSPSWEANSHSASKIPCLLQNPKVHYRVHKNRSLLPVLSQTNPIHKHPNSFAKIYSNNIFPSTPRSSEWSFPFRFSNQHFICISHLSYACYIPRPSLLESITLTVFGQAYKLRSSSFCVLIQPPATSSPLCPNILLSTLFSDTLIYVTSLVWGTKLTLNL
jgi:hypothetical protein